MYGWIIKISLCKLEIWCLFYDNFFGGDRIFSCILWHHYVTNLLDKCVGVGGIILYKNQNALLLHMYFFAFNNFPKNRKKVILTNTFLCQIYTFELTLF